MRRLPILDYGRHQGKCTWEDTSRLLRIVRSLERVGLLAEGAIFLLIFGVDTIDGANQMTHIVQYVSVAVLAVSIVPVIVSPRTRRVRAVALIVLSVMGVLLAWSLPFRNV